MKAKLIAGANRLTVCPATMNAVVQAWLDEEIASPVRVKVVEYDSANGGFIVKFERATEAEETQA